MKQWNRKQSNSRSADLHNWLHNNQANEESPIELPQSGFWETNILKIIVISSEDDNVRFRIEKLKDFDSGIPEPSGVAMLILDIKPTLSKGSNIKAKIHFGIPIEEIKAKGFDPNLVEVILLKWNGKQWIELPTKFLSSDGKYNYYESETPSFSLFAAVLKPSEAPTPSGNPNNATHNTRDNTHHDSS
ncbi:MAG: PGF-pre-PGF domain-containing protein [Archaeoglobaceae archaeon]